MLHISCVSTAKTSRFLGVAKCSHVTLSVAMALASYAATVTKQIMVAPLVAAIFLLLLLKLASLWQICTVISVLEIHMRYRRLLKVHFMREMKMLFRKTRLHSSQKKRKYWVRPGRTNAWWIGIKVNLAVQEEWKENFRMSRESFYKLVDKLRPFIEKQVTRMRVPVSADTQVAVSLYYLSDEGRLHKTANAFGLSRSCVSLIIRRVSYVISHHLGPELIQLPLTEDAVGEKVDNSFKLYSILQCLGAIDCTHIDIKQPINNSTDYINCNSRFSLNVQACCDYKYCFMDVVV
uniref:Nuclease HARBI1 n=1 Tax=Amphimedon queenslandica TaxID=400682 RepID=A0A1X7UYC9_AMPQE